MDISPEAAVVVQTMELLVVVVPVVLVVVEKAEKDLERQEQPTLAEAVVAVVERLVGTMVELGVLEQFLSKLGQ